MFGVVLAIVLIASVAIALGLGDVAPVVADFGKVLFFVALALLIFFAIGTGGKPSEAQRDPDDTDADDNGADETDADDNGADDTGSDETDDTDADDTSADETESFR